MWIIIYGQYKQNYCFIIYVYLIGQLGFPDGSGKESPCQAGRSLGKEDSLEDDMATHSSILAWEISWTEEPGRLQSMGLQKNWAWFSD